MIGLLDWELSTLGHPLSDLANLLQPWYLPPPPAGVQDATLGVALRGLTEKELPIPTAESLMKLYCKEVGREEYPIPGWGGAVSFAFFRVRSISFLVFRATIHPLIS